MSELIPLAILNFESNGHKYVDEEIEAVWGNWWCDDH